MKRNWRAWPIREAARTTSRCSPAVLAREGWKIMQQVEAAGGIRKAEAAGRIGTNWRSRRRPGTRPWRARRRVFVGTNQYPDPAETVLKKDGLQPPAAAGENEGEHVPRGAEPFESIRLRTEKQVAAGGGGPASCWPKPATPNGEPRAPVSRQIFSAAPALRS